MHSTLWKIGYFSLVVSCLLQLAVGVEAQTTVNIDDGETFTPIDLALGTFVNQPFVLGLHTTFEVNSGGVIGPIVGSNQFDFLGSTVNINRWGNFFSNDATPSIVRNVTLNLFDGGSIGNNFYVGSGAILNVNGGVVGNGLQANMGSVVNINGGSIQSAFNANAGSEVNMNRGSLAFIVANQSEINISGGFTFQVVANSGSIVNMSDGWLSRIAASGASIVNITGGVVFHEIDAFDDSVINIRDAQVRGINGREGSIVNVQSGLFSNGVHVFGGGIANISGGEVGGARGTGVSLRAELGSVVNITGGAFGSTFIAKNGSQVSLSGNEFRLNGSPVLDLYAGLGAGGLFTGTLVDGSVLILSDQAFDAIAPGSVALSHSELPEITNGAPIIVGGNEVGPNGLRRGQSLILTENGRIRSNFGAVFSQLDILGGYIDDNFKVAYSDVDIHSGDIGSSFQIYDGSTVEISGGNIGAFAKTYSGSKVDISGGNIGFNFQAGDGSVVSVSGGNFSRKFLAETGSTVQISGGVFEGDFVASGGSHVDISGGNLGTSFRNLSNSHTTISGGVFGSRFSAGAPTSEVRFVGGEFMFNGSSVTSFDRDLQAGDLFTGTLADGSVFIFSRANGDFLSAQAIDLARAPIAGSGSSAPIIVSTKDKKIHGLRSGQTLLLAGDGELGDNFAAVSSRLNIQGGTVGTGLEVAYTSVSLSGGSIGDRFSAHAGSAIDIASGTIGHSFTVNAGAQVHLTGGTIGQAVDNRSISGMSMQEGSSLFMSGGEIGSDFRAAAGTAIIFTGGKIDRQFRSDGIVEISGGTIGDKSAVRGFLSISGGSIGDRFTVYGETNIVGGTIGDGFYAGGNVAISDGKFGNNFRATNGSIVSITGGTVGDEFNAERGSIINIAGGVFGNQFRASTGSIVELSVRELFIDGAALEMAPGEEFLITQRGGALLSGTLLDGSFFDFTLNSTFIRGQDFFSTGATLTATLVPTPGSVAMFVLGGLLLLGRRR